MDKLNIAGIRRRAQIEAPSTDSEEVLALLDAIDTLLALPTPYRQGTHEEYKTGYDHGWNGFRREAKRLFGVEE